MLLQGWGLFHSLCAHLGTCGSWLASDGVGDAASIFRYEVEMSQAETIVIADAPMRWQDVVAVARHGAQLELSAQVWARIIAS